MGRKQVAIVYEETDYSAFKHLLGNRDVTENRKKKILDSISNVGYVMNPIVVNEKMEVIDGQGRLEALKSLNMAIPYVVAQGAGINECLEMNIGQENWKISDYVEKYAELGNPNYRNALKTFRKYDGYFSYSDIYGIVTNIIVTNGCHARSLKCGKLTYDDHKVAEVKSAFDFIYSVAEELVKIPGSQRAKITSIAWAYRNTKCDKNRLRLTIKEKYNLFNPVHDSAYLLFMSQLSDVYNKGISASKHIYFDTEYKIFVGNANKK